MNKKYFSALLLTIFLLLTTSVGADAADTAELERLNTIESSTELSIDNMLSTIYEGTWVETGYGFDLYLPKGWLFEELSEEEISAGELFDLADEEKTHHVTLCVSTAEEQNGATLETFYASLSGEAAQGTLQSAAIKSINGIYCATCTRISGNETDILPASEISFYDAAGNLFTIDIGPLDEEFRSAAANILCSLSPTEVAEVNTEETEALAAEG